MKHFYLKSCFLLLSFWGYAQDAGTAKQYTQIPQEYQSHPELGTTTHNVALHEVNYELVQDRTKYSRTFLNTNKTKTTVQSSVPLHYQTDDGLWRSIDYKLKKTDNKVVYPIQNPFFELDAKQASLLVGNQRVKLASKTNFIFVSADNDVLKTVKTAQREATLETENEIAFKDVAPNVDKNITLYNEALKYSYLINNASALPAQFDHLLVEEVITLPQGFSIQHENNGAASRLMIVDQKGSAVLVFQQPVISDGKISQRNIRQQPYEAQYNLVKINETSYKIQIQIDGSWLKSAERVFPINIDPVVTITNNDVVNSCFFPAYQQAGLQIAVPAGETVLSSNISYDFVAVGGSGA